jgi:hypothetical protein
MQAHGQIPELDRKGLRRFGLTTGIILVALFGLLLPWLLDHGWPVWPWIVAAPLWLLAAIQPSWLRAVYIVWMRFGLLASRITTPLILGIVFFLVISPMGLVRRLATADAMRREFDPRAESYRISSAKASADRLEKPF